MSGVSWQRIMGNQSEHNWGGSPTHDSRSSDFVCAKLLLLLFQHKHYIFNIWPQQLHRVLWVFAYSESDAETCFKQVWARLAKVCESYGMFLKHLFGTFHRWAGSLVAGDSTMSGSILKGFHHSMNTWLNTRCCYISLAANDWFLFLFVFYSCGCMLLQTNAGKLEIIHSKKRHNNWEFLQQKT